MSTRCTRVFVSGRVQGVFYRQSCAEEARRLELRGYVRNLPDGRVEALFHGESDAVEAMLAWCWRGPTMARVDGVESRDETPPEALDGFRVRR